MARRLRRILLMAICALLLAACGAAADSAAGPLTGRGEASAQSGTPTALPAAMIEAADAEYTLLTNLYERTSPSVVSIESTFIDAAGASATRRGSGFVYNRQGHIITNAHLVNDAAAITATLRNAYVLRAELVGLDRFSDLAVLKVNTAEERLAPLRIGESASVKVGQRAISIGNPFGQETSMTVGIVSGLGRTLPSAELIEAGIAPGFDNPSIIQIDGAIHPGNSGGPLLDSKGLVIGITTAMRSDSGGFQGIGFAVPADTMRRVIPDLLRQGQVDYAWMGISVMREDGGYGVAGLSEALDLPVERGVLLRGVTEGSPAQLAGLRGGTTLIDVRGELVCAGGDLIVAVNDFYFDDLDGLVTYLVQHTRPGDDVELVAIRDRRPLELRLQLQSRPAQNRPVIDCMAAQ